MLTHPRASVRKLAQRALAPPNRCEPQGCVTDLLRKLLQCPRAEVAARARALAQHGREVLPECLEAGRPCGPQTRRRLCEVFWHLGPQARGAEQMLANWLPQPEAEAALLAMEHVGSPLLLDAMIASTRPRRRQRRDWPEWPIPVPYPIWLDQPAVDRLCELALGSPLEILAVRALGGFGPARRRAIPLLSYLARKGSEDAIESLVASGFAEAIDVLLELGELDSRFAPDPRFSLDSRSQDHLLQALFRLANWHQHLPRLQQLTRHRCEAIRLAALRVLLGRHPDPTLASQLMRHRRVGVRIQAVLRLEPPDLKRALNDPHPLVRERAARRLAALT